MARERRAPPRARGLLAVYVETVDRYVPAELLRRHFQSIRAEDLQRLYSSLLDRGLSARTVRSVHVILRSAFRHARRTRRLIAEDPAELVELPPIVRKEVRVLTREESTHFLAALRGDGAPGLLLELMLATGLRPSEALAVRIEDVDFQAGTLTVAQRVIHRRDVRARKGVAGYDFGPPKSRSSRRRIRIPAYLLPRLVEQRRRVAEAKLRHGRNGLTSASSSPRAGGRRSTGSGRERCKIYQSSVPPFP